LLRAQDNNRLVGVQLKGLSKIAAAGGVHRLLVAPSRAPGFELITLLIGGYTIQYGPDVGPPTPETTLVADKYAEAVRTFGCFVPAGHGEFAGQERG
jgi:hypothetical protein